MIKDEVIIRPWITPFWFLLVVYLLLFIMTFFFVLSESAILFMNIELLILVGCFLFVLFLFTIAYMTLLAGRKYIIGSSSIKITTFGIVTDVIEFTRCSPKSKRFLFWKDILLYKEYFWFEQARPTWTSLTFLRSKEANEILGGLCQKHGGLCHKTFHS